MDPYLERHLNLADRRRLLEGAHLSRVQEAAVELLLIAEERLKVRDFVDRFKMALVSHDPGTWVKAMFPGWDRPEQKPIPDEPTMTQIEYVEDEEALMDTKGEWQFTEEMTPEEYQRVLDEMLANPSGEITVGDLDDDEGWI